MSIDKKLRNKVALATKWSAITEIGAKIIAPITNMVLARILAPEAFGVIASVTMIVSFADMFTDAGFQKYLVQSEFSDENEKTKYTNVVFWSNLLVSLILWAIIILFADPIAVVVGNPGLGNVISIACVQLPLTSFSSIQMALYRRDLDFKTLFIARIFTVCIPIFVTIPLAVLGMGYWSLIIGLICTQLSNAIILTIKSKWKPVIFYNFGILKKMLSFSLWSLIEAISIWFTIWIDAFIISSSLSEYYLGLYKTSTSMVNSLMAIITASTAPVLFSALSRLQNDRKQFEDMYYSTQRNVALFVLPIGVGVYIFSDLATQLLLGSKWAEASGVIGIWALTSSITIVFGHYCSEVYRALGKPKLSFLAQMLHLIVLIPVCIISKEYGFWSLVNARSWIRLELVLVHVILMNFVIGIPLLKSLKGILPIAISTIIMGFVAYLLRGIGSGLLWSFCVILVSAILYFGLLLLMSGDIRRFAKGHVKNLYRERAL